MKNQSTDSNHCLGVAPRISRWMLIVLLSLSSTVVSQAQVDVFMRVLLSSPGDSLPGNSDDPVYKSTDGWCRVRSFVLGAEIFADTASGGGGARRKLRSIALDIAKDVSGMSPAMFLAMAKGSRFNAMEIVVRKRGARNGEAYLKYELREAYLDRQNWTGSEDDPIETIRFGYSAFRMTVRPQSSTGELGAPVVAGWDFSSNESYSDPAAQ